MKVAVLSDIHGNAPALGAVMKALEHDVQRIIFLGDIVGYYPFVTECVDLLSALPTDAVQGNHDRVAIEAVQTGNDVPAAYTQRYGDALVRSIKALSPKASRFLAGLPEARTVSVDGARIFMVHGTPQDPLDGRLYPDSQMTEGLAPPNHDMVFMGNTHYPFQTIVSSVLLANPGSVGQARNGGGEAHFAIWDSDAHKLHLRSVAYDATRVIRDARLHNPHIPYLVEVLQRRTP